MLIRTRLSLWMALLAAAVLYAVVGEAHEFGSAIGQAKQAALVRTLAQLHTRINLFRFHHNGHFPAWRSRTPQEFVNHMCLPSDRSGNTVPPVTPGSVWGPYLLSGIPANPYTGARGVAIVSDFAYQVVPRDLRVWIDNELQPVGWFYNPTTGNVKPHTQSQRSGYLANSLDDFSE